MASYFNALMFETSDTKSRLAHPNAPINERIQTLLRSITFLESPTEPVLITFKWLRSAERVFKRVLANGGEDFSLRDDVLSLARSEMKKRQTLNYNWDAILNDYLLGRLPGLFGNFELNFGIEGWCEEVGSEPSSLIPEGIIMEQVLESYSTQPEGTWKRELFKHRKDVVVLARKRMVIWIEPTRVQVIPFVPSNVLWEQKVFLTSASA